jgi:hypothetical protein
MVGKMLALVVSGIRFRSIANRKTESRYFDGRIHGVSFKVYPTRTPHSLVPGRQDYGLDFFLDPFSVNSPPESRIPPIRRRFHDITFQVYAMPASHSSFGVQV